MLEHTNTSMKRETCRQTSLTHQINILALNRLEKTPKDNIIVLMVICKFSYPTTMPNWAKYAVALKLSPFSSSNHSISISSSSMLVLSAFLSMFFLLSQLPRNNLVQIRFSKWRRDVVLFPFRFLPQFSIATEFSNIFIVKMILFF